MTTEQALQVLRQLGEVYRGTAEEHRQIQTALAVLEEEITGHASNVQANGKVETAS